jgi:hypothetical protein
MAEPPAITPSGHRVYRRGVQVPYQPSLPARSTPRGVVNLGPASASPWASPCSSCSVHNRSPPSALRWWADVGSRSRLERVAHVASRRGVRKRGGITWTNPFAFVHRTPPFLFFDVPTVRPGRSVGLDRLTHRSLSREHERGAASQIMWLMPCCPPCRAHPVPVPWPPRPDWRTLEDGVARHDLAILVVVLPVGIPIADGARRSFATALRRRRRHLDRRSCYTGLALFITAGVIAIVVGRGRCWERRSDTPCRSSRPAALAVAVPAGSGNRSHIANRLVFGKRATPYESWLRSSQDGGRSRSVGRTRASPDTVRDPGRAKGVGADRRRVTLELGDGERRNAPSRGRLASGWRRPDPRLARPVTRGRADRRRDRDREAGQT